MGGTSDDAANSGGFGPGATGRYRIIGELGQGATANVWRAYDRVLGIEVALKRTRQVGPDDNVHLIKREFRTARDLSHPNLVRLYDLVVDGADTFFTMELVLGASILRFAIGQGSAGDGASISQVRRVLLQLARGVKALHDAEVIHRDIKPANILVEEAGRVVLVDYGFASTIREWLASDDGSLVGTVPYMAPERLWGAEPTPASDWYSVGVVAADLLLGRSLFEGSLRDLLRQKDAPPTTLRNEIPFLPSQLDALACGLLQREPERRPGADEILRVLEGIQESGEPASAARSSVPFVGRVRELVQLRTLLDGGTAGALIRVRGMSGIGKTALVQQALAGMPADALVLRGRCHPRERVPFAALDEVVDRLGRHLRRLTPRQRQGLRPPHADALVTLFPALGRALLDEQSTSTAQAPSAADPNERRAQAVIALRELLRALAAQTHVVVWIDDLQWADRDGLQLVRSMLSGPAAPAVRWIFCERTDSVDSSAAKGLEGWDAPSLARLDLPLEGISDTEAEILARAHGLPDGAVPKVVAEAGGYPFFVAELAHHVREQAPEGDHLTISGAINARVARLPAQARRVLEYLSLATEPLSGADLQALMGTEVVAQTLPVIESAGLVRVAPREEAASGYAFEPFHDRFREAVAGKVDDPTARQLHTDLTTVLDSASPRATARLAFHHRAAGDLERALPFTLQAAREAARSLAFGEASELIRTAVEIHPRPIPSDLYAEWADVLLAGGHCGLAAEQFVAAANAASAEKRDGTIVRRLKRQAGEQYLYAGHIAKGREVLASALRAYGIRIPRWPLVAALLRRGRFLLSARRLERSPRNGTGHDDVRRAERVDALGNIAKGTVMVDHVLGDALVLSGLIEAIRLGDARRLSRPLALEAASEANIGGPLRDRPRRLIEQAFRMAGPDPDPGTDGWLRLCRGTAAYFRGLWREAVDDLQWAAEAFRMRCVGATYEYATANIFLLSALAHQGRFREMAQLLPALAGWAQERGNVYASAMFASGNSVHCFLAQDDPARAIEEADRGLGSWQAPGFTSQNFQHFLTTVNALLYQQDAWGAWTRVLSAWPELRGSHFLALDLIGVQLRDVRARAALAAAHGGPAPAALARWSPRRLLGVVERDVRAIRRSKLPHADAIGSALKAGAAVVRGEHAAAIDGLTEALAGFDAAGMPHFRECARLAVAAAMASAGGPAEVATRQLEQGTAALAQMGVKRPDQLSKLLFPRR